MPASSAPAIFSTTVDFDVNIEAAVAFLCTCMARAWRWGVVQIRSTRIFKPRLRYRSYTRNSMSRPRWSLTGLTARYGTPVVSAKPSQYRQSTDRRTSAAAAERETNAWSM